MKAFKGWSIGIGSAIVVGTVLFLTSARTTEKTPTEVKALSDVEYSFVMEGPVDTIEFQTTLQDVSNITNIPLIEIESALLMGVYIDGYQLKIDTAVPVQIDSLK